MQKDTNSNSSAFPKTTSQTCLERLCPPRAASSRCSPSRAHCAGAGTRPGASGGDTGAPPTRLVSLWGICKVRVPPGTQSSQAPSPGTTPEGLRSSPKTSARGCAWGAAPGRPNRAVTPVPQHAPSPGPAHPAGRIQPLPRALLLWRRLGSGTAERPLPLFGTATAWQGDAERAQLAQDLPMPPWSPWTSQGQRSHSRVLQEPRCCSSRSPKCARSDGRMAQPGGAARLCWLQRGARAPALPLRRTDEK